MKIVLMEPLGVSLALVEQIADKLRAEGHDFTAYDSFSTDPAELIRRAGNADILMIANHPLPGEVIRADGKLKFISVAFVGIDHVDTAALADALRAGKIKAGIDVYEKDPPLPADHPLLGAPNLVCTPHVGFDTQESIERRAEMAFENVQAWLAGKPVRVMTI